MDFRNLPNDDCCGCGACSVLCPQSAIVMRPNREGFLYPLIDAEKCIACGKCQDVCPVLKHSSPAVPLYAFAAKAKDKEINRSCSSGGIFSIIASKVISDGGVVVGAAFDDKSHFVHHVIIENDYDLEKLKGSKYIQSELANVLPKVINFIHTGRTVLLSGCPCQIAAIKSLVKNSDSLLTIEVVCHGIGSPAAWGHYLQNRCKESKSQISLIQSRRNGEWRDYAISIGYTNGAFENKANGSYLAAYDADLINRKCCSACRFRQFRSRADISIGDFWGVEDVFPELDVAYGVSALMINSEKGYEIFNSIKDDIDFKSARVEDISLHNKALTESFRANRKRAEFFNKLESEDFDVLVAKMLMPPLWYRFLRYIKIVLFKR